MFSFFGSFYVLRCESESCCDGRGLAEVDVFSRRIQAGDCPQDLGELGSLHPR